MFCAWHAQQNLKKKSLYLNRSKKIDKKSKSNHLQERRKLYNTIINLPFCENEKDYKTNYEMLQTHDSISEELKNYLKDRHKYKSKWVKGYMKDFFTIGMCTSSRIEVKHKVYKMLLNSSRRLCEFFQIFQALEDQEFKNYKDEVKKLLKAVESNLDDNKLIKEIKDKYGIYVIQRMKGILVDSLNYDIKKGGSSYWYLFFFLSFFNQGRIVTRESKDRIVRIKNSKFTCECKDDIFLGLPCRHEVAIFLKGNCLYSLLPFNSRWLIEKISNEEIAEDPKIMGEDSKVIILN